MWREASWFSGSWWIGFLAMTGLALQGSTIRETPPILRTLVLWYSVHTPVYGYCG